MKICFISPSFHWVGGGSETIVYWFARELSTRHEVSVLCGLPLRGSRPLHEKDVSFERLTLPSPSRDSFWTKAVAKIGRMGLYDAESSLFFLSFLFSKRAQKHLGGVDVVSVHSYMDSFLFSPYLKKRSIPTVFHLPGFRGKYSFERDRSLFYVANSQVTKEKIESAYDKKLDGVVTPGVSSSLLSADARSNGKDNERSLLYVGRLSPEKGVSHFPEIFEGVTKKHPKVTLTIVGDGPERKRLEEQFRKKGLLGKVSFTGQLEYEALPGYYCKATLLVHCSEKESFGMTVLEAMAAGLPIVASDLPAIREATEGKAIFITPNDLSKWVVEIDRLLRNEALRKNLGETGKGVAQKHLWADKAREYEVYLRDAYQRIKIETQKSGESHVILEG
ncbi:MAG: glycosyltransferase family 4 protein [Candidatus Omnitrophica bacterium]|nr:glycosyltransferase family 4 protein [Candidatus Omnitrophota bacterium]